MEFSSRNETVGRELTPLTNNKMEDNVEETDSARMERLGSCSKDSEDNTHDTDISEDMTHIADSSTTNDLNHSTFGKEQEESGDAQALLTRSLVWDGYVYRKVKEDKNLSVWRCLQSNKKVALSCKAKAQLCGGVVTLVYPHNHGTTSDQSNHIPPSKAEQAQNKEAQQAAVKGFVNWSDRETLRLEKVNVAKRYKCGMCNMTFAISRVLDTHMMIEHLVKPRWRCAECGMEFLHGRSYNLHMVRSHLQTPYVCSSEGCSAVFNTSTELRAHKLTHGEQQTTSVKEEGKVRREKPVFKCPHCIAEFPHPCKLKYHMRTHTGERPYTCHVCSRTFRCASHRTTHFKNAHMKARQHLCNWCGKKFFTGAALKGHVLTHTGEKPYSCPVCSRPFSKKNAMIVHLRQHTGEKPYVCDQCGQSFTVRVSLRTHLKSKHNIVVDTSMYKRSSDPGDGSIPPIGRPKREFSEKQLMVKRATALLDKEAAQEPLNSAAQHVGFETQPIPSNDSSEMYSAPYPMLVADYAANGLTHSLFKSEPHSIHRNNLQSTHSSHHAPMLLPAMKTESYNQDVMYQSSFSDYTPVLLPPS